MLNERTGSEKVQESSVALEKALNSIVNSYVDSGLVARDEANTLREIACNVEGSESAVRPASTCLDEVEAFVLVNCELGCEEELIGEFRKMPSVSEIKCVFGVYDLVLKVHAGYESEVREIISRIRLMNNIKSTLTMMILES